MQAMFSHMKMSKLNCWAYLLTCYVHGLKNSCCTGLHAAWAAWCEYVACNAAGSSRQAPRAPEVGWAATRAWAEWRAEVAVACSLLTVVRRRALRELLRTPAKELQAER